MYVNGLVPMKTRISFPVKYRYPGTGTWYSAECWMCVNWSEA